MQFALPKGSPEKNEGEVATMKPGALVVVGLFLATIATAAYEEGEYEILELLDAHRVRLDAQLRLLGLSTAARHASIELDAAIGGGATP